MKAPKLWITVLSTILQCSPSTKVAPATSSEACDAPTVNARPTAVAAEPLRWPPEGLHAELQMTLQAVADVELRYELAREAIELVSGSAPDKQRCLAGLNGPRHTAVAAELDPLPSD